MVMGRSGRLRIGVFGGTFNPIHFGHLITAELIRNDYSLDKIIFIPADIPVHKKLSGMVSGIDRYEMIKLAISGNEYFEVSDIEIKRKEPSYTILTIRELFKVYPESSIFMIIGGDSFNQLDTWREYKEIIDLIDIVVLRREGDLEYREDISSLSDNFIFTDNPLVGISSTYIRERIKNDSGCKYLVPESVRDYIKEKRLYKV
jgi:nicotinate-nucleotide adenylyltransferase